MAVNEFIGFDNQLRLEPERLPLLVTGIAGVAGWSAFRSLRERYGDRIFGQRRRDNRRLVGPGVIACDLEDRAAVCSMFEDHRFAAVLDAGGTCALKNCEADPLMARRVNVLGTANVTEQVRQRGIRLVRLSIDLVFGGTRGGGHREFDEPDPVTMYGLTMVEAEQLMQDQVPQGAILRISLPMADSFNGHAGAIDWIAHRFRHGRPATLYYDEVRTPTYCECLDPIFERVLASELSGIHHVGGPRPLSLFEIAQIVNRVGGFDPDLLHGRYRMEAGTMPPRAGNVTLSKATLPNAFGLPDIAPWPLNDQWVPTDQLWHYRRAEGEGSERALEMVLQRRRYRWIASAADTDHGAGV